MATRFIFVAKENTGPSLTCNVCKHLRVCKLQIQAVPSSEHEISWSASTSKRRMVLLWLPTKTPRQLPDFMSQTRMDPSSEPEISLRGPWSETLRVEIQAVCPIRTGRAALQGASAGKGYLCCRSTVGGERRTLTGYRTRLSSHLLYP